MMVVDYPVDKIVRVKDIEAGAMFVYSDTLFMKIEGNAKTCNCVRVDNGSSMYLGTEIKVTPRNDLVITNKTNLINQLI